MTSAACHLVSDPGLGACLLAVWVPLFGNVYCVPEIGQLRQQRGQDPGRDNAPIVT